MFKVNEGFWFSESEKFQRNAADGFSPRFGFTLSQQKPYTWAEINYTVDNRIALLHGEEGSGKSAMLRTILYNTLSCYAPDTVELYMLDCVNTDFKSYLGLKLPQIMLLYADGQRDDVRIEFMNRTTEQLKKSSDKVRFVIINEYQSLVYTPDMLLASENLCKAINSGQNTYGLFLSKDALGSSLFRTYAPIRMCLSCDEKTAKSVVGTKAPALSSDKFGFVWYTPDIYSSPVTSYCTPYVPARRLYDEDGLQKDRMKNKAPQAATTLVTQILEGKGVLWPRYGITFRYNDYYVTLGKNCPTCVVPDAEPVVKYLEKNYRQGSIYISHVSAVNAKYWLDNKRMGKTVLVCRGVNSIPEHEFQRLVCSAWIRDCYIVFEDTDIVKVEPNRRSLIGAWLKRDCAVYTNNTVHKFSKDGIPVRVNNNVTINLGVDCTSILSYDVNTVMKRIQDSAPKHLLMERDVLEVERVEELIEHMQPIDSSYPMRVLLVLKDFDKLSECDQYEIINRHRSAGYILLLPVECSRDLSDDVVSQFDVEVSENAVYWEVN